MKDTVKKAVNGLSRNQCARLREFISFVARGPRRGWWTDFDQAVESFSSRKLKSLKQTINWDAIKEIVQMIIEAIQEAKGK